MRMINKEKLNFTQTGRLYRRATATNRYITYIGRNGEIYDSGVSKNTYTHTHTPHELNYLRNYTSYLSDTVLNREHRCLVPDEFFMALAGIRCRRRRLIPRPGYEL